MFYLNLEKKKERYDISKFMEFMENEYDILSSYFITKIKELQPIGVFKVSLVEEYRPDLLSYKAYEDTQYWWILLQYNNILSFEDITLNKEIKFPSISAIEDLFFILKTTENSLNSK